MHGRVNRRKDILNLNHGGKMRKAIVNLMHGQESENDEERWTKVYAWFKSTSRFTL